MHPAVEALIQREPSALLHNNDVISHDKGRKTFYGRLNPVSQTFELSPHGQAVMQREVPKQSETLHVPKRGRPPKE